MNVKIGEKIKSLRKAKGISQEVLAQYLGVSFQSVSKWETGTTMPDVALIPAIASFFNVSTDELFDFNLLETEKRVGELCDAAYKYRFSDPARSEAMLRDALSLYPGNDIILANLLYTMRAPERRQEVVELCGVIVESTKLDEIKYDALRIMAETYKDMGEYRLCKATIERIPEFYFSKLGVEAQLLEGDDMYAAALHEKDNSAETLVEMLSRLAGYYEGKGDVKMARLQLELLCGIVDALERDRPWREGEKTFFEYMGREQRDEARKRLKNLADG